MPATSALIALPFELHLRLFDLLDASSIMAVLSLSRQLRPYARSERIFAALCARHGVHDISRFQAPHDSYFAVYTRVLHIYGQLCGLWASDLPFLGSVIEVRYSQGDADGPPGIVAETWNFTNIHSTRFALAQAQILARKGMTNLLDLKVAREHLRIPLFHIGFPPGAAGSDGPESRNGIPLATAICYGSESHGYHEAVLALPDEPPRRIVLNTPAEGRTMSHPDFPPRSATWMDSENVLVARGPIRSTRPVRPEELRDTLIKDIGEHHNGWWFDEEIQTRDADPQAVRSRIRTLSIDCACRDVIQDPRWRPELHELVLPEHYTRIRDDIAPCRPAVDPAAPFDHLAFGGLWLGDFGDSGTEVIWLEAVAGSGARPSIAINASKITGDRYVPRGVQTWQAFAHNARSIGDLDEHVVHALKISDGAPVHVFDGVGVVSPAGFTSPSVVEIVVAFVSPDLIRIWWPSLGVMRENTRYDPNPPRAPAPAPYTRADIVRLREQGLMKLSDELLDELFPPRPATTEVEEAG
jgi:hypothetical protein